MPGNLEQRIEWTADWQMSAAGKNYGGVLIEANGETLVKRLTEIAKLPGSVILPQTNHYRMAWLIEEISTSINTTAAGGNASLMTIG